MEYEMTDEHVLFDESTNPSLLRHDELDSPVRTPPKPSPQADKEDESKQRAEVIPEEEHQLA